MWTDAPGDLPAHWEPSGSPSGSAWYYEGTLTDFDGHWEIDWQITADTDPFISAGLSVLNTWNTTLTFNVITSLPVSPSILSASLIGGSTGGSVTDANFDGSATAATSPGFPFFNGELDSAGVLPLHPDPSSWSVGFAGGTVNIPAVSAGLPGPTLPGPPVLSTIGIHHTFTLTPGDRIAMTSFFVAVPEPSTLGFLAIGMLALLRRTRR
jgi:hypothetical protein